jgi:hypothetical protein
MILRTAVMSTSTLAMNAEVISGDAPMGMHEFNVISQTQGTIHILICL